MPETTEAKTVRLPTELWQRLDEEAKARGVTRNRLLRKMAEIVTRPKETT